MEPDPLARLRTLLEAFPPDWAYDPPRPSRHVYEWGAIERRLGVSGLPADYKQLMESYGPLVIAGIFVVNPDKLAVTHDDFADSLRQFWSGSPEDSRPICPEVGGLLLCASTEGRDVLWWDTSNTDPDRWTITWDVEFDRHTFNGTLTDLLIAELSGRLEPRLTAFTIST